LTPDELWARVSDIVEAHTAEHVFEQKKRAPAARLMAEKHEKTPKSSRNGHSMDATGWESIPRSQKNGGGFDF